MTSLGYVVLTFAEGFGLVVFTLVNLGFSESLFFWQNFFISYVKSGRILFMTSTGFVFITFEEGFSLVVSSCQGFGFFMFFCLVHVHVHVHDLTYFLTWFFHHF